MKKQEPEIITNDIENRCTCDEYNWSSHPCPYRSDVGNDSESECNCCPYCTQQCLLDI